MLNCYEMKLLLFILWYYKYCTYFFRQPSAVLEQEEADSLSRALIDDELRQAGLDPADVRRNPNRYFETQQATTQDSGAYSTPDTEVMSGLSNVSTPSDDADALHFSPITSNSEDMRLPCE